MLTKSAFCDACTVRHAVEIALQKSVVTGLHSNTILILGTILHEPGGDCAGVARTAASPPPGDRRCNCISCRL